MGIAHGDQDRQKGYDHKSDLEEEGISIGGKHPSKTGANRAHERKGVEKGDQDSDQADDSKVPFSLFFRRKDIHHQNQKSKNGDHNLRSNEIKVNLR